MIDVVPEFLTFLGVGIAHGDWATIRTRLAFTEPAQVDVDNVRMLNRQLAHMDEKTRSVAVVLRNDQRRHARECDRKEKQIVSLRNQLDILRSELVRARSGRHLTAFEGVTLALTRCGGRTR